MRQSQSIEMVSLLDMKKEGSTCSFSSASFTDDELIRPDTGSVDSQEDEIESTNVDRTGVEVQAVHGKGKRFLHQITSSNPYLVFVGDGKSWWRRRSTKFWLLLGCFLILLIVTIAVPASKRTKKIRKPTKITDVAEGAVNYSGYSGTGQSSGGSDSNANSPYSNTGTTDWIPLETNVGNEGGGGTIQVKEVLTSAILAPLSNTDPTVYFPNIVRPTQSSPSSRLNPLRVNPSAIPTNAWYQNLLLLGDGETPTSGHHAYTMPYMVDVAGPIPGIRVQLGTVETSTDQVIVSTDQSAGLTLGVSTNLATSSLDTTADKGYNVLATTELGITLEWANGGMKSSIVRGMAFATMIYPDTSNLSNPSGVTMQPTIYGEVRTSTAILVDNASRSVTCGGDNFDVNSDLEITFVSGKTWLIYFSQAVTLQCIESDTSFALQVMNGSGTLIVRLALIPPEQDTFESILRQHATVYPGENTHISYEMGQNQAGLVMNWDPQPLRSEDGTELITFAMPHHQDRLEVGDYCVPILLGRACLVKGNTWTLVEQLPPIDFVAPRTPDMTMLPDLVKAINKDLSYRIPQNFLIGAGDTYFSGKALGKLARILIIAEQVNQLCSSRRLVRRSLQSSICGETTLPDATAIADALDHLRQAVEVWLYGTAQAPLLYDSAWGGVVSCGCNYSSGTCQNTYPDCPGVTDQGLNFGAGFYNDHHFHYGYHIHAAAVLAHFNPDWGVSNFDRVLILIRDIANPSRDDPYFPLVRHKDWYHGSSWASGISLPVSPTGMNQESSSEAIAAYEAVALFGKTMSSILTDNNKLVAQEIYDLGRLLTATELRSTKKYWQVSNADSENMIFDSTYQHNVVGILWSSKAFFGTWFGNSPYLIYGIQLLPITPISEERDDIIWAGETFDMYAQTCDTTCVEQGWSVQLITLLATLGHKEKALELTKNLTNTVFTSPGGNGHSMSNTIWYISTRAELSTPYILPRSYAWESGIPDITCLTPSSCTDDILGALAGEYDCRSRIEYVMKQGRSEYDACYQIAVTEFPDVCGLCSPIGAVVDTVADTVTDTVSDTVADTVSDALDSDNVIVEGLESAISPIDWITCNQPTRCTSTVLQTMAGPVSCGDRIDWLITTQGLTQIQACRVVAVYEFPDVCGGCNPDAS